MTASEEQDDLVALPRTGSWPSRVAGRLSAAGWLWVIPAVAGVLLTVLIMVVLPADRTVDNVGELLLRLSPLCAAVAAVAMFPRGKWGAILVAAGVLCYMGLVDTVYVIRTFEFIDSAASGADDGFARFYQFTLFVNAFTVLFALFAFRLGGASTASTGKAGVAGILIVISGLNDLTYWLLADWPGGRPARLEWASHIEVFVGHPPSVIEAAVFLAVHLLLAAGVLLLPLARWHRRVLRRAEVV